ncbi:MAG TPA: hypothetical protein VGE12_11590 [Noviherbaspirillum sp.]
MRQKQFSNGSPAREEHDRRTPIRHDVLVLVGAALAAHAVASTLTVFWSTVPTLTAIAATLTFAAVWLYGYRRSGSTGRPVPPDTRLDLYVSGFTVAGTMFGAWIITATIGEASAFYCAKAVPWRVEVALFGSFAVGLLSRMGNTRGRSLLAYPLALVALLWIAPYYGYFSGAAFLGISVMTKCPDQSIIQIAVAALAMTAGKILGGMLAAWLLKS